jgi:actin-related protein
MGFYLNFEIEQFRIKEEIKDKIINNLPEKDLTLVKISSRDKEKITWTEDSKEFRYNGNMFDVVNIKIKSDTTCYYCFNDEKESQLFTNLDKLVKEQTDNSRSRTCEKKQDITYFFHEFSFRQCLTGTLVLYLDYLSTYKSISTDVLSPPPRIISIG